MQPRTAAVMSLQPTQIKAQSWEQSHTKVPASHSQLWAWSAAQVWAEAASGRAFGLMQRAEHQERLQRLSPALQGSQHVVQLEMAAPLACYRTAQSCFA